MGLYDWDRMKAEEISDLYTRKVAIGESFTVARVEVKLGAVTQPHSHENEEVILVLIGSVLWNLVALGSKLGKDVSSPRYACSS